MPRLFENEASLQPVVPKTSDDEALATERGEVEAAQGACQECHTRLRRCFTRLDVNTCGSGQRRYSVAANLHGYIDRPKSEFGS